MKAKIFREILEPVNFIMIMMKKVLCDCDFFIMIMMKFLKGKMDKEVLRTVIF